ncbi:helix-turn-helix domain-containing protein [Roseinatronobacter monicus]|uniref:Transcriptional regulator n=1 Tax=Roseinatronobacter monicus TaxID=393481 RepID=A0A543K3D2_9RHOB|nr:helix-turn-helix transcriptional regulator [Roseinatronobacter monicus]TQM89565.1 transcriptional regulator [Roseinatronobacter monicus]
MAHPIDIHVGKRLRERRLAAGMTQSQLSDEVSVKYQQIQKYETGANRVSSSRLWEFARALKVPITFFFDGIEEQTEPSHNIAGAGGREVLALVRIFRAIPEAQRKAILDLATSLGKKSTG